jgi:uncharacterized membrane protein
MFPNDLYPNRKVADVVDTRHTVLIALVILGGALLRLFMLTNQSLWFDEGQSLVVTDSKTLAGTFYELSTRPGGDKYQPLYFFVLSIWRSVMGDSEFSLRILSVMPGVVALFFMYATVANVYGSRHAFWSTTYLTVSAFWICYSQEVRPYSLLFALGAFQLFLLSAIFTAPEKTRGRRILLFAAITGISCFASVLLLAFSVALAIAHVSIARSPSEWVKWWAPVLLACLPAGIYLMGTPAVGELAVDSTNGLGLPLYKNSLFAIYGILVGHTYGPPLDALRESGNLAQGILSYAWQLSALAVVIIVLATGFIRSQKYVFATLDRRKGATSGTRFFLVLLLCSFVIAVLVAKVSAINWMPRHSFYLSIPLAILLPLTFMPLSTLRTGMRQGAFNYRLGQSAQIAFVALLAMNLYASYNYFYKNEYWRDDYRSAASYLASNMNETDRAIMLWGEPRLLSYYGDTATQNRWEMDPPPVSSVMDGVYSDGGKVFVAINREFTWSRSLPTTDNLETQVAEKYNLLSVKRYVNFNIYEFENIKSVAKPELPLPPVEDTKLQTM